MARQHVQHGIMCSMALWWAALAALSKISGLDDRALIAPNLLRFMLSNSPKSTTVSVVLNPYKPKE